MRPGLPRELSRMINRCLAKDVEDRYQSAKGGSLPPRFHDPMPSPDGLSTAGHYQAESGERIAVIPIGGGPVQRFETVQVTATWSPDGKAFIYVDTHGGASNLMRQAVTGGPATPITKFTSEQIFWYAVSPDQKQIALVRGHVSWDVVLVSAAER